MSTRPLLFQHVGLPRCPFKSNILFQRALEQDTDTWPVQYLKGTIINLIQPWKMDDVGAHMMAAQHLKLLII